LSGHVPDGHSRRRGRALPPQAGGGLDLTGSPAYPVEFAEAGHLAWTDLNANFQASITEYSLAFLNRYLKGDNGADPSQRRSGVAQLRVK
jgi:hypothetical protein